ncbi:MAG: hypothetical protein HY369_04065 [Candidatus Aenigmarchaeota archaeon]|nr:hypothetical protein [Candidatus Aenigmarchaeota archaeon]
MERLSLLGGTSTKELIIELIASDWPLTARKIHRRLGKQHGLAITYQAVHKAVAELAGEGVLEKTGKGYRLSEQWIGQLSAFSQRMRGAYEQVNRSQETRTLHKFVFRKHNDFIRFHLDFVQNLATTTKSIDMLFLFRHVPYPHVLSPQDIERLGPVFRRIRWTIHSGSDTPLDRWCARHWRRWGAQVRLGVSVPTDTMTIVTNEYVTSVFLSPQAIRTWDRLFAIRKVEEADIHQMSETLQSQSYQTIATVLKDKDVAALLRQARTLPR